MCMYLENGIERVNSNNSIRRFDAHLLYGDDVSNYVNGSSLSLFRYSQFFFRIIGIDDIPSYQYNSQQKLEVKNLLTSFCYAVFKSRQLHKSAGLLKESIHVQRHSALLNTHLCDLLFKEVKVAPNGEGTIIFKREKSYVSHAYRVKGRMDGCLLYDISENLLLSAWEDKVDFLTKEYIAQSASQIAAIFQMLRRRYGNQFFVNEVCGILTNGYQIVLIVLAFNRAQSTFEWKHTNTVQLFDFPAPSYEIDPEVI